MADKTFS